MADQNDYKERFKRLTSFLHRSLECPICLETVKDQFKICSRGHAVCLDCLKDLTTCVTCEAPFTLENIICLKNVLEVLPKFCRYSDAGCGEIVDRDGDHETFCGFRPINCAYGDCDQEMFIKDLKPHFEKVHFDELITEEFSSWCSNWDNNALYATPILLFNSLFWLFEKADKVTGQLIIIFGKIPIKKSYHNYYVKIKMEQAEFAYTHTLKAELINNLLRSKKSMAEQIRGITGVHCMKIPLCELTRFRDSEGRITYSYTFFKDDTV